MRSKLRIPPLILFAIAATSCDPSGTEPTTHPADPTASQSYAVSISAETTPPTLSNPSRVIERSQDFSSNQRNPTTTISGPPIWTLDNSLILKNENVEHALSRIEKPGIPAFDRSANTWFASANGTLVRIHNGSLTVVADNIQGIDIDVRSTAGIAVSREPNDTIVLHKLGKHPGAALVLLTGPGFHYPRFSPDGKSVLVSESHPNGSRIWVSTLDGNARVLASGDFPTWHPDGSSVVFVRVTSDGYSLRSSEVWAAQLKTGEERIVGPVSVPAISPSLSPDGTKIAFSDGRDGGLYWATYADPFAGGR